MNLNRISILVLLFLAIRCSDLLPPTHATTLKDQSKARGVRHQPKATDLARLIHELRAGGAAVNVSKETISQPFFAARGRVIHVNSHAVWVFSYANATAAEKDAAKISSDGMTIGHSKPSWLGTPHFFRRPRMIILYLGDEPRILEVLRGAVGPQFAGG